ncbi:recombinase family protein [Wenyingzhuangia sp. IMCC45574]
MLAIYCRISRDKSEGKDRSIEDQRLSGIEWAEKLGLTHKVYTDEGISGTKGIKDRPGFASMLDDIEANKVTHLYAYDQSRLERSPEVRHLLKAILSEHKVALYTKNGKVDTESNEGEMMGDIFSLVNQYYVRITSNKIKSVLRRNAQAGKAHAKVMPYGYTKDNGGYLIIDEEEAIIVRNIYAKCLSGVGTSTIRKWLNDEKIPTRYNKIGGTLTIKNRQTHKKTVKDKKDIIWSDKQVQDILKNPVYKGVRKWGEEYFKCPAIFNEIYWKKVQLQLSKNSKVRNTGRNVDHKYLLKGLLECGKCNSNYYGKKRLNKKDNFYMCSSKRYAEKKCNNRAINIDVLEKFIWNLMYGDKLYKKVKEEFEKKDTLNRKTGLQSKIDEQNKKIEELKIQFDNTVDLVTRGIVTESEVSKTRSRIESEKKTLNEILEKDNEEYSQLNNQESILEEINLDWVFFEENTFMDTSKRQQILERQANTQISYNDKRILLKKYIKRIFINYDHEKRIYTVTVSYNLPIDNENYLIDSNYIACYSVENKTIDQWFFNYGKRFTRKKVIETISMLSGKNIPIDVFDRDLEMMVEESSNPDNHQKIVDEYFQSDEYKEKTKGIKGLGGKNKLEN